MPSAVLVGLVGILVFTVMKLRKGRPRDFRRLGAPLSEEAFAAATINAALVDAAGAATWRTKKPVAEVPLARPVVPDSLDGAVLGLHCRTAPS